MRGSVADPQPECTCDRDPYLAVLGLPAGEAVWLTLHWDVLVAGQRAVTLVAAEVLQVPESLLRSCAVLMNIIFLLSKSKYRVGILGHQGNKRLEPFPPCYVFTVPSTGGF
jgi:hypothetical protein